MGRSKPSKLPRKILVGARSYNEITAPMAPHRSLASIRDGPGIGPFVRSYLHVAGCQVASLDDLLRHILYQNQCGADVGGSLQVDTHLPAPEGGPKAPGMKEGGCGKKRQRRGDETQGVW